ncbi:MAG: glycosyltransferase family 4 protein [Flavobacteriales bacterium]|nr:glycosyltransferase family 4 protein [Flavobacteriales bacterium]
MKQTILITAYAVNPYKGSEDGTGWNISKEIAKDYKTIIITRKNNRPEIERYFEENNDPVHNNMKFEYHDLPRWAMSWKKKIGPRGYVLYFYLWQLLIPFFILKNKLKFDLCHALNFHSDSHPHFLWVFGKPVIWGPIGHHPKMPVAYIHNYGKKVVNTDRKYAIVKWIMRNIDPFFYLAKWNTDKIIGLNSSVQKDLRLRSSKVEIIPAVAAENPILRTKDNAIYNVLSVGRFTAMKGFDMTILAFSHFVKSLPKAEQVKVKLTLVGAGESEMFLRSIIKEQQIGDFVNIVSWVEKSEMEAIYNDADIFLFPSHEGAGMVVPEALSYGVPVICFDNVGPGELVKEGGIKIPYTNYNDSIHQFAIELNKLYFNLPKREELSQKATTTYELNYTWEIKGKKIKEIIAELIVKRTTIAVFHPSAELYGADRILVNALKAVPVDVYKKVYLFREGPLRRLIESSVENAEIIIRSDMPVIYREIFSPLGIMKFIKEWFMFLLFLRKEKQQNKFVSAYVNTLSCSFLLPLLWLLRIRRFVHVHEIIDSPKIIGAITAWISQLFANKIVCVSKAVLSGLKRYVKNIEQKGVVIHNGINAIIVNPKRKSTTLKFYLFGRIKPEKGQWFLIEALATIPKEKLINTKFILMGGVLEGQEQVLTELQEKIVNYDLQEYVLIKDFASNIESAMSDADVCLIPSLMKAPFPTTVLEAMSAAKPVITTNHGGAKEAVIDQETGFLVNPNNLEELANSIVTLIDRKFELPRLGRNARRRYQKRFTINHFNRNWVNFNTLHKLI